MKKTPQRGGCWYCHTDDPPLLFSTEFDTYVHEHCLQKRMKVIDMEARIMAAEFGIEEKKDEENRS